MLSREALLVIGVVFHIIYLFSIFDIYFTSPLVHGMNHHRSPVPPPADRVVLIVGDGLRADKLFELETNGSSRAPYLRSIVKEQGAWGISHTRVPTESRPGHVAIIAGFYEDVSAVTTGWTMNPVHFDSVFNQSRHTWSFGSPDILPMFQHGASDISRVDAFMYPHEFEEFSGDASHLDTWVFDHVRTLFKNATHDKQLDHQLRQNKNVFFLHLLGLDTNGHAHRPYSKEYYDNIGLVDRGVKDMVELIENFYGHDGKTSYVFTADHGMNNRGAHGDGHPDNTRTPIIAWGAGIRKPILSSRGHDDISATWKLDQYERQDVLQADIAPLMSHLVGIQYPANSVGQLPLAYLDADEYTKAEAAFANAREILAQYEMKHDEKQDHELFFKSFPPLSGQHSPTFYINSIQQLIDSKDYIGAEKMSRQLIALSLEGLRYFQTYDWFFLRGVITAGFVGWCIYCLEFVLRQYLISTPISVWSYGIKTMVDIVSGLVFLTLAGMIWIQKMPSLYYAYVFFPVFFWNQIIQNVGTLRISGDLVLKQGYFKPVMTVMSTLLILEALVYSFFEREILSVIFILISFWPLVMPDKMKKNHISLLAIWMLGCWSTSIFTMLPVEKDADIMLVVWGGLLGLILGLLLVWSLKSNNRIDNQDTTLLLCQLLANGLSIVLVYSVTISQQGKQERLPFLNQISNWIIVGASSVFPFIYRGKHDQDYLARLLTICFAFAPLMTLLSVSYEMLFYVCLCMTVLTWLELERRLYQGKGQPGMQQRSLQSNDIRTVLLFLFFINVGFFGTGNVASMSSFTLESVYRFVTVFSPFLMGALLITKVLIPFFVISSVFGVLTTSLDLPPFSLFLCVVAITDIQTINFFYFVSDYGSWLEIGTSISHFCIAELFIIFTILLFLLSRWLVGHLSSFSTQVEHHIKLH
ncbi:Phosphatidylinositolglycan class N-domain-containing protein [Halteromyces radiatus]|uniref:Phosphatidylinositolglycan class N-domain-containing protein n=1 Tax=Halteromyces radiatus TaxID=101107 RepID=UPI0022206934|nr:Phosphatidylinositolglycan class N-domain-containing protein [Halteromyces radiatus]KAI8099624.1 Phosphatidylinositolglycan class N-domain-containing protein [Halteromyces radiatus]